MMNKNSFIIHKSYYEPIKHLTDQELGLLFRLIFEYQNQHEPKKPTGLFCDLLEKSPSQVKMAFSFFKNQFDQDALKYQKVVERNQSNGSKGGRPKKEETEEKPKNPVGSDKPKKADNGNGNDKDIISSLRSEINLSEDLWQKFLEHRKKVKASPTIEAQKLVLEKLKGWKAKGHDPEEIIKNSIENGWKGVFEPKQENVSAKPKQLHNNFKQQDYAAGTKGFLLD